MTDKSTRRKHTGEPGNGGRFGSQTKPEAETSLGYSITRKTRGSEIKVGDIIFGSPGVRTTVRSVTPSSAYPGSVDIETDLGFMQIEESDRLTTGANTGPTSTLDALPADLHQKLDDAVTAAFPDSEPVLFSPVSGLQDGYVDLIAYDSEDGRSVKFTMDPDGEITSN
jgi:hypothetical protein